MLRTANGSLYTGITTDVKRRFKEHSSGIKGAKSLRGKGPLSLVLEFAAADRSEASVLEARIKQLTKEDKERLVSGGKRLLTSNRD